MKVVGVFAKFSPQEVLFLLRPMGVVESRNILGPQTVNQELKAQPFLYWAHLSAGHLVMVDLQQHLNSSALSLLPDFFNLLFMLNTYTSSAYIASPLRPPRPCKNTDSKAGSCA